MAAALPQHLAQHCGEFAVVLDQEQAGRGLASLAAQWEAVSA
ncbi:MAG: hypothetical protein U1E52_04430 [Geminicoccaceae bacterium]